MNNVSRIKKTNLNQIGKSIINWLKYPKTDNNLYIPTYNVMKLIDKYNKLDYDYSSIQFFTQIDDSFKDIQEKNTIAVILDLPSKSVNSIKTHALYIVNTKNNEPSSEQINDYVIKINNTFQLKQVIVNNDNSYTLLPTDNCQNADYEIIDRSSIEIVGTPEYMWHVSKKTNLYVKFNTIEPIDGKVSFGLSDKYIKTRLTEIDKLFPIRVNTGTYLNPETIGTRPKFIDINNMPSNSAITMATSSVLGLKVKLYKLTEDDLTLIGDNLPNNYTHALVELTPGRSNSYSLLTEGTHITKLRFYTTKDLIKYLEDAPDQIDYNFYVIVALGSIK